MKAYLAIKYHEDQRNRAQIEQLTEMLAKQDVEVVCITQDVERWGAVELTPTALMRISFAEIDTSDVVIVELSEKGVGLGIEAGYAHARHIPVVTVARRGSDISMTLQGISDAVFWYDTYETLQAWLLRLPQLIRQSGNVTCKDRNPRRASEAA